MPFITPIQQHALGWDIFPMLAGRKGAYAHYLPDGSTQPTKWVDGWTRLTEEQVEQLWPGDGRHNVGLATGRRSGVWVLDVDRILETEAEAREYVAEMTGIEIPDTLSVRTASGKWHFYFAMPESPDVYIVSSVSKLAPNVDVRGDGGMAMGICSRVDDGDERAYYEVVTMMKPVYAPLELVDRVKRKELPPSEDAPASVEKDIDPTADAIAAPWIEEELQRLRDLPRPWHEGAGWHDTCFNVACQLAEFANSPWCSMTQDDARARYLEAAPAPEKDWNPLTEWREGQKKTEGQGRAKPAAAVNLDWFHEAGGSNPSEPGQTTAVILDGEKYASPDGWDTYIEQVQDSGATFMLAAAIRRVIPKVEGTWTLANFDGVWHYYEGSYWAECAPEEVSDYVSRNIALVRIAEKSDEGVKLKPLSPTMGKVSDVEQALASLVRRRVPTELEESPVIYTSSGSLTIADRERVHSPASPAMFNLSALPFAYDPAAVCPQWEAFLADLFEHDPDARLALQEWFGYFLVGNPTWLQKMFWLIGPKRSGKGTILNVARMLLGNAATATSLTMLSKDFGRENLIGRRLAIIDDARDPDPRVAHSVVEFLLTLSAGGFTTIARKHRRNWDGVIPASLMAASNTIPRMPDEGGAVSSRLEVIRTKKSFIGHEDTHLGERLATELPGILNWALVGLDRLREQQRFTQAAAAKEVREEVDRGATGATPMVRDLLMQASDPSYGLSKRDLRDAADWWAQQQEDAWRPNRLSIKSAILAEFPDARDNQRAQLPDGTSIRGAWKGIVLKCRACELPATRVLSSVGPECNLHLSNTFLSAAAGA